MFGRCSSLNSLPNISNWNTANVTDMSYMFYGCSSLISLPDISKWNTNNVTTMYSMFCNCSSLKNIKIDNLDIANARYSYGMFSKCPAFVKPLLK